MLDHDDEVLSLLADDDIPSAQPHPDDKFGMEESPAHAMLREVLLHGRCEAASMGAAPEPPPCDAQSAFTRSAAECGGRRHVQHPQRSWEEVRM